MDSQIGAILRRARNRRKVELSEVEAATRIRLRYLRAIEAEEWDVLPGGVYTRGFIRTYATFLGLDGDRLADEYRASVEGPPLGSSPPLPIPAKSPAADRGRLGWLLAAAAAIGLAALVIALLPRGDDGGVQPPHRGGGQNVTAQQTARKKQPFQSTVSMQLAANAEVWVCLLDARGQPLVDGQILEAGAEAGPFRSGSFTVSFGNGEVAMTIDGRRAEIPTTSSPVGYSIDAAGSLTELSEAERPTCT
jgi:hypothetical protein